MSQRSDDRRKTKYVYSRLKYADLLKESSENPESLFAVISAFSKIIFTPFIVYVVKRVQFGSLHGFTECVHSQQSLKHSASPRSKVT